MLDSDSPPSKVYKLSRTDTHCIEEIIEENKRLKQELIEKDEEKK